MKRYELRRKKVQAYQLERNDAIKCYNGTKIGMAGDYVVTDEHGRVMIIKRAKFEGQYREVPNEICSERGSSA